MQSSSLLSNGSGIYTPRQILKAQASYLKKLSNAREFYSCYNAVCCQACAYSLRGVPCDQLTEEEEASAWLTGGSAPNAGTAQKWTAAVLQGTTLKDTGEGTSTQWDFR